MLRVPCSCCRSTELQVAIVDSSLGVGAFV